MSLTHLSSYRSWLSSRHYSNSTIRNYCFDLTKFLNTQLSPIEFLDSLRLDKNYSRFCSSLKTYFDFCLDQRLITQHPLANYHPSATPEPTIDDLINMFIKQISKSTTPATTKNYLSDLRLYVNWLKQLESH